MKSENLFKKLASEGSLRLKFLNFQLKKPGASIV